MRGLPGGSWDAILGTSDYYRDRQTTQRFALLNALTGFGPIESSEHGMVLAAWSDGSPLAADLGGRDFLSSSTTLYLISLRPQIYSPRQDQPSTRAVHLDRPVSQFRWEASPYGAVVNPGGFSLGFKPLISLQNRPVDR